MEIGVQTGLHQEALPEGLRNELFQSNADGSTERKTSIVSALHDGASLNDKVDLQLQREFTRDKQFGAIVPAAPVIIRQPRATGVATELASADAANWDTCEWFLAGVPTTESVFVPSFTLPAVAGSYFCRFTNATGSTDSDSIVVS